MPKYRFAVLNFFLSCDRTFSALLKSNCLSAFIPWVVVLAFFFFPLFSHASLTLTGKLNINDALEEELLLLPNIDSVKAGSIIKYRERKGLFSSLHTLLLVDGIGRKTYDMIMPFIKLSGESDLSIDRDDRKSSRYGRYDSPEDSRVLFLENDHFFTALLDRITKAQKSIHLSMFIFKTSPYESNKANILLNAIVSAAERGVDVSALLEESNRRDDSVTIENKKTAKILEKNGVRVRFDSPKRITHTKAIVIDSRYVFIGSHNFTHSALRYNNEVSLFVDSETLAEKTLNYIKDIN